VAPLAAGLPAALGAVVGAPADAAPVGALDAPPPLHAANTKLAVAASARNLRL
jgi:hypothetical protein